MIVTRLKAREFRGYRRLDVRLGERLTAVVGDNGAGKTNLLEALYLGCVGRSCRTRVDTQAIQFDSGTSRVEVEGEQDSQRHTLAVAIDRTAGKTFFADDARRDSLDDVAWRPPVAVFMPDRLELVKGAPGVRRAHLDQLVAALWPARRESRRSYAAALAQRNALLARGNCFDAELDAWDGELARHGSELIANRAAAIDAVEPLFVAAGEGLGLAGDPAIRYRSGAGGEIMDEPALRVALRQRRDADRSRGFSTFGPHRDEVVLTVSRREVRTYGSQGQQRLTLLAMLLAECEAISAITARRPLVLLDDVMSELDRTRREMLTRRMGSLGQTLITATELAQIPGGSDLDAVIDVSAGQALRRDGETDLGTGVVSSDSEF